MNPTSSKDIASEYLKGFFNAVDSVLGSSTTVEVSDIKSPTEAELAGFPAELPVAMSARVLDSPLLLLLSAKDVLQVLAASSEEAAEPKQELEDGDLAAIKDVFDPCLGAAAASLKEKYDKDVPTGDTQIARSGPEAVSPFGDAPAIAASFKFSASPQLEGAGVLLFTETLESLAPEREAAEQAQAPAVDEITPVSQDNIDMVLDIQLIATARLGRVEMPISEILSLGPGSIIEVGHIVDEPVDLLINEKLIARGDVVVVDEKFGLRITEIISPEERIESLR